LENNRNAGTDRIGIGEPHEQSLLPAPAGFIFRYLGKQENGQTRPRFAVGVSSRSRLSGVSVPWTCD
jgi:hypothetical protein